MQSQITFHLQQPALPLQLRRHLEQDGVLLSMHPSISDEAHWQSEECCRFIAAISQWRLSILFLPMALPHRTTPIGRQFSRKSCTSISETSV